MIALAVLVMPVQAQDEKAPVLKITDKEGRSLEATILGAAGGQVSLRRNTDGREFSVPLDSLSKTSQEQIASILEQLAQQAKESAIANLELPEGALATFKTRWEKLQRTLTIEGLPTRTAKATSTLVDVLALEKELIIAASPVDPASPVQWPDEVDPQTRRETLDLRQSIRTKDRTRLLRRLGLTEERANDSLSDRQRLNSLYDSTLKPLKRSLTKAQKALAKEKESKLINDSKIEELEKEIKGLEATVSRLKSCFFGIHGKEWWSHEPNWPEDHPAEILRREIAEARRAYHEAITKAANHAGEGEYQLVEIDGESFYSANFGVILDTSGSMTPHIKALKEEIDENFLSPLYREVMGCKLEVREKEDRYEATGRGDTMSYVEEMLLAYKVDTIYWFSDLNDPRSEQALYHLEELLRLSGARLYVRSVDKNPDRELKKLIEDF
ncbi:MAG: hypothetical protein R3242_00190 [Akkermansiaceae bacterium]|nr:hypothetical protein [Akkermansiaceae bacterium]